MLEKARVTATHDNMARIMVLRSEMCGTCDACPVSKGEEFYMEVYNEAGAKEGDDVEVEMENNNFLNASLIVYGIPLLALILGILLGYFAYPVLGLGKPNEIVTVLTGFIFTAVSYMLIRHFEPHFKENDRFKPVIKHIVK